MPRKIPFTVVAVTGEDDSHRAKELNLHGPTVHGWQSARFCEYPQELIIELESRVQICKIQILSHQYLIASQVEIYVGELPDGMLPSPHNATYKRLGYISLSTNERTGFKARELKSIHVNVPGSYVKFIIHKYHANQFNVYEQVGMVALNVIGNDLPDESDETAKNKAVSAYHAGPDYISPLDDLTFDMYQDPEIAQLIRKLEARKLKMIGAEKYDIARKLKIAISELCKAGEKLGKYEIEKWQAIDMEDYEKARRKKSQMEEFRLFIYDTLQIPELLGMNKQKEVESPLTDSRAPPEGSAEDEIRNSSQNSVRAKEEPIPDTDSKEKPVETRKPEKSKLPTLSRNSSFGSSPTSDPLPITRHTTNGEIPIPRKNSLGSSSTSSEKVVKPKEKPKEDESPRTSRNKLPPPSSSSTDESPSDKESRPRRNYKPVGASLVSKASKPVITNYVTHEERSLPALKSHVIGDPFEEYSETIFSSGHRHARLHMTEQDKRQAALPIEVFGSRLVQYAYSKQFHDREDSLNDMKEKCLGLEPGMLPFPPGKVLRAATFLLQKGLKDIVLSVFTTALNVFKCILAQFLPKHKVPKSEVVNCLEKALPEILNKLGDKAARQRLAAQDCILDIVGLPEVNATQIVPLHCCQPLPNNLPPRLARGQAELVEQLVYKMRTNAQGGLSVPLVMDFAVPALSHALAPVRECAERIVLTLYRRHGYDIRSFLPLPDEAGMKRNTLYRHLFDEMDRMDDELGEVDLVKQNAREFSPTSAAEETQLINRRASYGALLSPDPAEVLDKLCIFCGVHSDDFVREGLDVHYWKHCPMLIRCSHCKQVVEVSGYTEHLLSECGNRDAFIQCDRCLEAIPKLEYSRHVAFIECTPAKQDSAGSHCPLCHKNIPPGEDGWRKHLMGANGCPNNPRTNRLLAPGHDNCSKLRSPDVPPILPGYRKPVTMQTKSTRAFYPVVRKPF